MFALHNQLTPLLLLMIHHGWEYKLTAGTCGGTLALL